ncbi:MAG: ribosomal protein S18-alanine N-acetyltransferase [Mycobacterium sp.]
MTIVCDELVRADAARCAELEAILFPGDDPWPEVAFIREVAVAHNRYVGARVDDLLVGYAGIARLGRTAPFEYEIHTIGVDPDHQRQGIARRMMTDLLDFAGPDGVVFLEVRTDNEPAIALYESLGFVQVGLRKRYYRTGADAYTMRRGAS